MSVSWLRNLLGDPVWRIFEGKVGYIYRSTSKLVRARILWYRRNTKSGVSQSTSLNFGITSKYETSWSTILKYGYSSAIVSLTHQVRTYLQDTRKSTTSPPQGMMVPGPVISTTSYSTDWKDIPVENWILLQIQNNPKVLEHHIRRRNEYFEDPTQRIQITILYHRKFSKYVSGFW